MEQERAQEHLAEIVACSKEGNFVPVDDDRETLGSLRGTGITLHVVSDRVVGCRTNKVHTTTFVS
jgi:hypothetical protein